MRKNRRRLHALTALLAALSCMAAFSMTAYAGGPDYEEPPATEETPAPEESAEPTEPLTPEGNLTLVDDVATGDTGEKQFITVVSKNGNYFYLVIDRADDGEGNVHFLNLVDEADLLALIEDGEESAPELPAACTCTGKCTAGDVDSSCPVCKDDLKGCKGMAAEPEPEVKEDKNPASGILAAVLALALIGGGAFCYVKFLKPKQAVKGGDSLEDFDFEEEEYGDGPEPDTENAEGGREDGTGGEGTP